MYFSGVALVGAAEFGALVVVVSGTLGAVAGVACGLKRGHPLWWRVVG